MHHPCLFTRPAAALLVGYDEAEGSWILQSPL